MLIYYNCTFAVELSLIIVAQWAWQHPRWKIILVLISANIIAIVSVIVPFKFFNDAYSFKILTASALLTFFGSITFALTQKEIRNCPLTTNRWVRQGLIGFIASLILWGLSQHYS